MALMSAKLTQIRLMVCEQFFSTNVENSVEFLHAKILKKRSRMEGNRKAEESSLRSLIQKVCIIQRSLINIDGDLKLVLYRILHRCSYVAYSTAHCHNVTAFLWRRRVGPKCSMMMIHDILMKEKTMHEETTKS
jgi:hypothetical protein